MTTERFLFSYQDALRKRKRIEARLNIIREDMQPKSPIISDMPKSHNVSDGMAEYMAKIDELQSELLKAAEKALQEMQRVTSVIDQIDAGAKTKIYQDILNYRYINNYKWEDIASALHYQEAQIYRLRIEALECVSKILDDCK